MTYLSTSILCGTLMVTHFGDPLPANASAEDGAKAILRGAHAPVPVHIAGNCIGVLSPLDFRKIAGRDWANIPVTALMTRWDDLDRITPAASAVNAVRSLRRSKRSHLAVIATDGNLIGFINSAGVTRFISKRLEQEHPV